MIIIGSQALDMYTPINRKKHDWDFVMSKNELEIWNIEYVGYLVKTTDYSLVYDIAGDIIEIRNPEYLDPTDKQLLDRQFSFGLRDTPYGQVALPPIQEIYDIKKSTALCIDEHKHHYDVKLIEDAFSVKPDTQFFQDRLEETMVRTAKSNKTKYDFFHKYHIPEYIIHDRLHEMVADLIEISIPTYVRTITGAVETDQDLYNKLTHAQKVSLMVEEALVLSLERWFIPQNVENGINHRLIDMFYNNNEAMPTYLILKHVNITGLKGEADYVVKFGRDNFFEIENEWVKAKEKIRVKGGFQSWFYDELFKQRNKYKAALKAS